MTKTDFNAILRSSLSAMLAFLLVNSGIEYLYYTISGVSLLHGFEQKLHTVYGMKFHAINLALFSLEIVLAMFVYALFRQRSASKMNSVLITSCFILLYTILFLGQMINLGIYPLHLGIAFLSSTIIAFPVSLFIGASVYDEKVSF